MTRSSSDAVFRSPLKGAVVVDHRSHRAGTERGLSIHLGDFRGEPARVDGRLLERVANRLRPPGAEQLLGQPRNLEEEDVPRLAELAERAQFASHASRVRHVHDHETSQRPHATDGEHPCLGRAPVVPDERHVVATGGVDQRGDVGEERIHRVVRHLRRFRRLAIASKVRCPHLVSGLRQRRDLVAPRERQLREPVQQQRQSLRTALVRDRHLQLHTVHGNRPVRQWIHRPMMPVGDPGPRRSPSVGMRAVHHPTMIDLSDVPMSPNAGPVTCSSGPVHVGCSLRERRRPHRMVRLLVVGELA